MKKMIISFLKIAGYIFLVFLVSIIISISVNTIVGLIFALLAIWLFPLNNEKVFTNRFNDFRNRKGRIVATLISLLLLVQSPRSDFIILNSDILFAQSWSATNYTLQYKTQNIKSPILNWEKINPCTKDVCSLDIKLERPITNINVIDNDDRTAVINYVSGDKVLGSLAIKREKNTTELQEEENANKIAKEQELKRQEQQKIEQAKQEEEKKKQVIEEEKLKKEQDEKDRIARENRPKINESCFSPWNGVHINGEEVLKKSLNDPDSYKHDETRYSDNGKVIIKFRAKNWFWWYTISYMVFQTDADCSVNDAKID